MFGVEGCIFRVLDCVWDMGLCVKYRTVFWVQW